MIGVLASAVRRAIPVFLLGCSAFCLPAWGRQGTSQPDAANSANAAPAQAGPAQANSTGQPQTGQKAGTAPRHPRRRRSYSARQRPAQSAQTVPAQPAQVAPSAEQRARDQKILEQQKAQSARIARENDVTIKRAVSEQQRAQAEPRIQDAPGVDDQPLPGAAVVPPTQPAEPPRIQDAPGPAQTLPKAAPATAPAAPQ